MSYEKQNFEDNTTLYASQLNHMEDGIDDLAVKIDQLSLGLH